MKAWFLLLTCLLSFTVFAQSVGDPFEKKEKPKLEVQIYNGQMLITDPSNGEITVAENDEKDKKTFKTRWKNFRDKEKRKAWLAKFKDNSKKTRKELKRLLVGLP